MENIRNKKLSLKQRIQQFYIIQRYKSSFKKGLLAPDSKEYKQYIEAVWQHKNLHRYYQSFQRRFDRYLKPFAYQDAQQIERKHQQVIDVLHSLAPIELIPRGMFENAIADQVDFKLQELREQERAAIRETMQQELNEAKRQLTHKEQQLSTTLSLQLEEEKARFYHKILPFTIGEAAPSSTSESQFVSKEFHRLAALQQQQREQELADRERQLSYQEQERSLDEKRLALQEGKLHLDHTAKSQELRSQRIELEALGGQLAIDQQKLSLQEQQIAFTKKEIALEIQLRELELERKFIELTNLAATIMQEKRDLEIQQKHIEVINLLADYEMKTREFDVLVTTQLLGIKDQQLSLKSEKIEHRIEQAQTTLLQDEIEHRIKQAQTALQQEQTKLEIESRLLSLQDREFTHKANEALFEIERNRHGVENKLEKLELKEQGVELLFKERNLEVATAHAQIAHKENNLTLAKMELLAERNQLLNRLALSEHQSLNAQNKVAYLNAGKGNIWSTLAFLWSNRKQG